MSATSLQGVSKRFRGRPVLDHVSYDFAPATRYVIRGASGTGKSTLLNLLAGYLDPDEGTVRVDGPVGYLFQDEMLFGNLTARENLQVRLAALGVAVGERDVLLEQALRRVGVETHADETVAVLSGGERQRVELAGLLLAAPRLVLMDEPTSRLDEANQQNVATAVDELFSGLTVIVVTHATDSPLASGAVSLRLEGGHLVEAS